MTSSDDVIRKSVDGREEEKRTNRKDWTVDVIYSRIFITDYISTSFDPFYRNSC